MKLKIFQVVILLAISSTGWAQTVTAPLQPAVVDSMAFYNATKKPAISDTAMIEYAPTIQADGKTIIYGGSPNGKRYNLYQTTKEGDVWGKPLSLDPINSLGDSLDLINGPSLSFDGSMLYFFRAMWDTDATGRSVPNEEIFYSARDKDTWSTPKALGAPINTKGYEGFPSISADGSTLYFVRQNVEGPRDRDLRKVPQFCYSIYRSEKDANGNWGKPIKLPWPINQDCEKAPRIMADGRTLIFSSNRPGGKGGFDMYQSKRNDLGEWGTPEHLDFVNTELDDQLPCISAEGDKMFYTYNNKDIYSVTIPYKFRQFMNNIVQGYITDQDTKQGIPAKVVVTDALTSQLVMTLDNNPSDGRYTVVLPVGRSFNIEFIKEGYSSFTSPLDLLTVKKYEERSLDVQLFKSVRLNITINDKEIFEPINAEVKIRVKGQNSFLKDIKNSPVTGLASADLPVGQDYEIIVNASNFKSEIVDFDVSGLVVYRDFEKFVELVPEKTEVMVNVSDLQNNSKVKSRVIIKNKTRDEIIEVQGNQMVSLRTGDRYEVEVTSDQGYAFNSTSLDLTRGGVNNIGIQLMKLEQNAKLTLKDINFESNSAVLTEASFVELRRVIQLLKENPGLKVEIAAHTDDVGSDSYNFILSEKRAKSVAEFLLQNNILSDRFISKGYGESLSKVPNTNEVNRGVNRRVELKILSI
jgi:outer membrane protein OmpA-like peptidoglycan-associated protein/Tol biopolymer transport system component